jgi:hypothetical protein
MATQTDRFRSGSSVNVSDLFAQFRWFVALLVACAGILVAGVVSDTVFGYPVFGGLLAAFALVSAVVVLAMGLGLLAYRIR